MQPILVIALIGVAAAATSVGFLNTNIMLTVQNFGVGEETLETPISDANIDFSIGRMVTSDAAGRTIFMNIIDACSFHYPEENTAVYPGLAFGSTKVICKLTDKNGNVVAEGTRVGMIDASQTVHIAITDLAYDGANKVNNIHDVTIVALGSDPTFFEANPVPPNEAFTSPESSPFSEIQTTNAESDVLETVPSAEGPLVIESDLGEIVILSETDPIPEAVFLEVFGPFGTIESDTITPETLLSEVDPLGEAFPVFESSVFESDPIETDPTVIESSAISETIELSENFLVPESLAESFLVPESISESAP